MIDLTAAQDIVPLVFALILRAAAREDYVSLLNSAIPIGCLIFNKSFGQQNLPSVIFNWTCFDPPSSPAAIRPRAASGNITPDRCPECGTAPATIVIREPSA